MVIDLILIHCSYIVATCITDIRFFLNLNYIFDAVLFVDTCTEETDTPLHGAKLSRMRSRLLSRLKGFVNLDLDCNLDNFNPDIKWISM